MEVNKNCSSRCCSVTADQDTGLNIKYKIKDVDEGRMEHISECINLQQILLNEKSDIGEAYSTLE